MIKHTKGTTIKGFDITEIQGLDRITVYYEDLGPGQGRITIVCFGKSWSSYWGAMGEFTSILSFFNSCDEHYIAKNLSQIRSTVNDYDKMSEDIGEEVTKENMLMFTDKLCKQYGGFPPELPEISNHEYEYLCKIIKTVQEAIDI